MPDLQPILKALDELIRDTTEPRASIRGQVEEGVLRPARKRWIIEMVAYDVAVNADFLGASNSTLRLRLEPPADPLRQGDDPRGGAGTGDAQVDRACGECAGLEIDQVLEDLVVSEGGLEPPPSIED